MDDDRIRSNRKRIYPLHVDDYGFESNERRTAKRMILYQLAKWMEEQEPVHVHRERSDVDVDTDRYSSLQHLQPPMIKEWTEHFPQMVQEMERFQSQDPYT